MQEANIYNMILKYEMTPEEIRAYKMSCTYESLVRKLFPDMKHGIYGVTKDPRKKQSFKYSWKAIHDFSELKPAEDKYFVYAQLKIFQSYVDKKINVFISPNCLVGEKAWKRWTVFKIKLENQQPIRNEKIEINQNKIINELKQTKNFLFKKFQRHQKNDIHDAMNSKTFLRWVTMLNISHYYVNLSPVIKDWLNATNMTIDSYFGAGISMKSSHINEETVNFFKQEFAYEFIQ